MKIDAKATAAARKRQQTGIARLRQVFGWTPLKARSVAVAHGRNLPFRARPGVPPLRPDPEYRKRRRRRKIAHESRRRNRA